MGMFDDLPTVNAPSGGISFDDLPPAKQPQAEMSAYNPTWRETVGGWLSDWLGNTAAGDRVASGLVGSSGLGHTRMSISDVTPARIPMYAQEAKRAYERGDTGEAFLDALAATPAPILGKAIDATVSTARPVVNAAREAKTAVQARLPGGLAPTEADDLANRVLAGNLRRAGVAPDDIAADLAEGQRAAKLGSGNPAFLPEAIADVSDTTQRLTGSVYRTGGEAGEIIKPALIQRKRGPENPYAPRTDTLPQGQLERVVDYLDRALEIKSKPGARKTATQLEAEQAARGRQLYKQAEEASEPFDLGGVTTGWMLKAQEYRGQFRDDLMKAIDLFSRPKGAFSGWEVNTVRRFDNAKKVLDDLIEKSKGEFGKATNLTRELKLFKDDLLAKVHEGGKNKFYQQARDEWGSAAENREAIELGRKALNDDSAVTVEVFKELTPAQQKLFRIGLRDAVRLKLAPKKAGDSAISPLQQRRVIDLLKEVIPRPKGKAAEFSDRPVRFGELIRREGRMDETMNKVIGGSPTQQRARDDATFASDALARFVQSGRSLTNVALESVGSLMVKVFGYRQDVAAALARKLITANPIEQQAILREIRRLQPPERFTAFADGLNALLPAGTSALAVDGEGAAP